MSNNDATTAWVSGHGYTFAEAMANNAVQGLGIILSIAGLALLVVAAAGNGALPVTASAIFGATLIVLYTVSTVYHALPAQVDLSLLAHLDHIAIYLLIAGTYTPFALVALGGAAGWWLFGAVWTLAVLGALAEFSHWRFKRAAAIVLYLGMGWLGMAEFPALSARLGTGGTTLLLAGGAAYTLGVPFYLWERLRYHNVVWHALVLTGSVLHFFAVWRYVLP